MFLVPFARRAALSRSLDHFFDPAFFGAAPSIPALDLSEDDKAYTVRLDVPGVAKEDVQVAIEGRRVSVQATTRRSEDKTDGPRAVYRERQVRSFSRSFLLPAEPSSADASAKLENGVLTLVVPKAVPRTVSRIAVN